ncbi:MAG: fluoride efflux transporter CrcB [Candidatus Margulisiibacteriota bacterium]
MKHLLLIGSGGFIGAVLRYLAAGWVHRLVKISWFPVGTLGVNVTGCFVIGLLGGLADNLKVFTPEIRMFLLIGILGSYTTFSTFGYETLALLRDNQIGYALINITAHIILGLFAVWLGYAISTLR